MYVHRYVRIRVLAGKWEYFGVSRQCARLMRSLRMRYRATRNRRNANRYILYLRSCTLLVFFPSGRTSYLLKRFIHKAGKAGNRSHVRETFISLSVTSEYLYLPIISDTFILNYFKLMMVFCQF